MVTLTAATRQKPVYVIGELEEESLVADVREFILEDANVRGLKRAKHSPRCGAEWCKMRG